MAGIGRAPSWKDFRGDAETLADLVPEDAFVEVCAAPSPVQGGVEMHGVPDGVPEEARALLRDAVEPFLRALDAWAPLERDPASGVWETLVLRVNGWSGNAFVSVRNLLGAGENVTTFGTSSESAAHFGAWCRTRRQSRTADTPWDAARRERVVLVDEQGQPSYIDPGAVRLLGIAAACGVSTTFSCEGHPEGAYLVFSDRGGDFTRAMQALEPDWRTEVSFRGQAAYMRPVGSTAERDKVWRFTCASLEKALGLSGDLPVRPDAAAPPAPGVR